MVLFLIHHNSFPAVAGIFDGSFTSEFLFASLGTINPVLTLLRREAAGPGRR